MHPDCNSVLPVLGSIVAEWYSKLALVYFFLLGNLATVRKLVYPARTKWYDIGLELQLSADTLDAIECNRGNVGDHLRDMLKHWLKRVDPTPTSKTLVDALKSDPVGESRLAYDVENDLHSLPNPIPWPHSSDKSILLPLSRQYQWITVVLILTLLFLSTILVLWCYNNNYSNVVWRVMYHMNLLDSKSLPSIGHKIFVGREMSTKEIIQEIDYAKPYPPIHHVVGIVGPPGFGKSTLAIHIGHEMVADGVLVHYVDMTEVFNKQALAEKILAGDAGVVAIKNITIDRLYKWVRGLYRRTLLILDNCDGILHNTTGLQTVIEELLDSSPRLKILITSRKSVLQMHQFTYRLQNLSSEASCTLLQRVTYHEGLDSTTCKSIADLTGNVPLALQVVGAILNSANTPDLMTIMDDLEKDFIPTLSPEDLPVEKRVNASISLSYQYLTPHLQTIGRYLANFPGSFTKEAACSILNTNNKSTTCSELSQLVKRSLVEYERRTNRYQFHKVMRAFFLKVSKESTGKNETKHFFIPFQSFYADFLQTLTEKFNHNHVKALMELDTERHNILHLLECIGIPNSMTDVHDDLHAIRAVESALSNSLLRCRFTPRELLGPIKSMVEHLSQKLRLVLQQPMAVLLTTILYFQNHVLMTIHLADLEEEINGASKAVEILDSHKHTIDKMKTYVQEQESAEVSSRLVSSSVILFYKRRSDYYSQLGEQDKVKECHETILRITKDLLNDCEPGKCQYADIGRAYYTVKDYAMSAQFIQLALDLDSENSTVMVRAVLMTDLCISYHNIHNTAGAGKVLEDLNALLLVVEAENETELYNFALIQPIIMINQLNDKFEEVTRLKNIWIKAAKPTKSIMIKAHELAKYFLKKKNYPVAADFAEFALQSSMRLDKEQLTKWELTQIRLTVGLAKFLNWNLSEGLDYMELAVDYVCENMTFVKPSFNDWQFTFFIVIRGHLCPLQNILQSNVLPFGVRIVLAVFDVDVLLDVNSIAEFLGQKLQAESQSHSHSTEMVMTTEGILYELLLPSVSHLYPSWLFSLVYQAALLSIWLGIFVLNVAYVMEKLVVVLCLAYYSCCCVAKIVHYCRIVMKFAVYVVILYVIVHVCDPNVWSFLYLKPGPVSAFLLPIIAWLSITLFQINILYFMVKLLLALYLVYLSWRWIHVHVANVVYYCKMYINFVSHLVILYGQCGSALFSVLEVFPFTYLYFY